MSGRQHGGLQRDGAGKPGKTGLQRGKAKECRNRTAGGEARGTEKMSSRNYGRRSKRQAERWKRKLERYRAIQHQIENAAPDILSSSNFRKTRKHIQHGNVTVNSHVMNVARYSLALSERMHIRCSERELVRGALLHDYFLYDWHQPDPEHPHKLHGFYHPGTALRNASKEYRLTQKERDIIKHHMWPLTVKPPGCREAWIVTAADKWCSLMETIHMHKGHGAARQ